MAENLLPFKISSGLKNIIGRDLITDDYVAVFELVKNAYDAHANLVLIEFSDSKIIIEDDGKGMSKDDIVNKWLFVAYSAKKEGTEDDIEGTGDYRDKVQLKRYYAGAKGIGRFSCDRLGNRLTLTTRKEGSETAERIKVNWDEFDQDANKEFLEIKVKHETLLGEHTFANGSTHGTRLVITELNELWGRDKKKGLKKSLEKLINPFDSESAKYLVNAAQSFSISIKDDSEKEADLKAKEDHDRVNGEVKNFIFEKLNLKTSHITATIDEEGKGITITLVDRGTLIYKIRKPNNTPLKNIVFHLFFLNQAAKTNFTKTVGIRPVNFGSIYLYKNGFRIAPFGDPGDDSFNVERRHGQAVGRTAGLRDIVGRIEIFGDEEHKQFKEATSRNGGFIKNEYTEALIECFTEFCLRKLEAYVFGIARKATDADDKNQEDTSHLENLKSQNEIFKLIRKEVEKGNGELEELDKNFMSIKAQALSQATREAIDNLKFIAEQYGDAAFKEYAFRTSTEYERLQAEKEELARILTETEEEVRRLEEELRIEKAKNTYLLETQRQVSNDAKGLVHSIKITTKAILSNVDTLWEKIVAHDITEKETLRKLGIIRINAEKAIKITKLITRANFKTTDDKQTIDLAKFTEQYFSLYNEIHAADNLHFEVNVQDASLERKVDVLELSLVFDNFISNSGKAEAQQMLIECLNPTPESLSILLSDDGKGVRDEFWKHPEKMFDLGATTTDGSGIGLFSVKENLKKMSASVRFVGNGERLKGATFEILFP